MIPIKFQYTGSCETPVVLRMIDEPHHGVYGQFDAKLMKKTDNVRTYETNFGTFDFQINMNLNIHNDVLFLNPYNRTAHRIIRADSLHNTLLITEQCDQLCIMCSQPPKKTHNNLFEWYKIATLLAPQNSIIGISGGEPTLYKTELFDLIEFSLTARPDLSFHILTNAQHFSQNDVPRILENFCKSVVWGVPIYSSNSSVHDRIVGKEGAFHITLEGLNILAKSRSSIELRTVVLKQNIYDFESMAFFVSRQLPFISLWAIMQLEEIGFAKSKWRELFFDTSIEFNFISNALDISRLHGIDAYLYNFPLCTIPEKYRMRAKKSISDWKRKYLSGCLSCSQKESCTGFFNWYTEGTGFMKLNSL